MFWRSVLEGWLRKPPKDFSPISGRVAGKNDQPNGPERRDNERISSTMTLC